MPEQVSGLKDTLFDSTSNSLAEASVYASVQSQREKDQKEQLPLFSQSMARFHAMDLFDIQDQIKALSTHVQLCCPQVASHFGSSSVRVDAPVDSDLPVILAGRQLSNLCQLLDSLSWLVDEKVHIQQMAGASGAGYVQM